MQGGTANEQDQDSAIELIRSASQNGYNDALWHVSYLLRNEYLAAARAEDPALAAVLRRLAARVEDAEVVHRREGLRLTQQMALDA
jgi:hypothetical protein